MIGRSWRTPGGGGSLEDSLQSLQSISQTVENAKDDRTPHVNTPASDGTFPETNLIPSADHGHGRLR